MREVMSVSGGGVRVSTCGMSCAFLCPPSGRPEWIMLGSTGKVPCRNFTMSISQKSSDSPDKAAAPHARKSHFLGTKLRALRKRNGLTLEELSARCIQADSAAAPSVSYLSMIESG